MTDRIIVLFAILICIGTALFLYKGLIAPKYSDVDAETPIDYALEPFQEADPDTHIPALKHSGSSYNLTPKAKYQISGILVSKRRYRRGYMSWLSPYDYAIIWGKAPEYLPYLKFDQIVRFCLFEYKNGAPIDIEYLSAHMSNNHLIPSTLNLRRAFSTAQKKDLVSIEGFLVYVSSTDKQNRSSTWNSSLSRDDKGNGACEIIYVTRLRINDKVYE